jgi:putative hydrolase of the HAD superfamily
MSEYSTLFLDLDETLYPGSNGLWTKIGDRIQAFMVHRIGIPADEASQIRSAYLEEYGTTLNGLLANYDVDPLEYLEYVHDVDLQQYLGPDPVLREMLASIHTRRVIFTNGHANHAQRVLDRLGVPDLIDTIIDIVSLDYCNKPRQGAYERALHLAQNPDPAECVYADDRPVNLEPAHQLGMTTVLVNEDLDLTGIFDYRVKKITDLLVVLPELGANVR